MGCSEIKRKYHEYDLYANEDSLIIKSCDFIKMNVPKEELSFLEINYKAWNQDIKLAVNTCREALENNTLPFDLFCEYVLPIRLHYEPIQFWRQDCQKTYAYLKELDVIATCNEINNRYKDIFKFENHKSGYKPWSILKNMETGNCYDMVSSLIYPLRALGTPATYDFIHGWGNANGSHAWNVVYVDGEMKPCMGIEEGPGTYDPFKVNNDSKDEKRHAYRYPAKVYRRTASINHEILSLSTNLQEEDIPFILRDSKVKDVTSEYVSVMDLNIPNFTNGNVEELVYVCIFNSNSWIPITVSKVDTAGHLCFKHLKVDMLYHLCHYKNGKVILINCPFIFTETGNTRLLTPNFDSKHEIELKFIQPLMLDYIQNLGNEYYTDIISCDKNRKRPINGNYYYLYYWAHGRWVYHSHQKAINNSLHFEKVPSEALYHLATESGEFLGRCFVINNNTYNGDQIKCKKGGAAQITHKYF